jgi:hypothetical protein
MAKADDSGVVGGVNASLPILMTMAAFLAIALYNVVEITFLIFTVFKQRRGLYFWSLLVATWGIAPHGIGFVLKFFQVTTIDLLSSAIVGFGWACMVTGQSVVLYSRLHLVVQDQTRIKWVLYMIIFDAIALGVPLFTLAMGANSKHAELFLTGFLLLDKIQLVVISVQEMIISLIYIVQTVRLLGSDGGQRRESLRKLFRHLILVNIVVLIFDITLLAVQFSGHYEIQTTYKTAVYSVKLKIEFSVLNRLVSLIQHKDLFSNQRTLTNNTLGLPRWTCAKESSSQSSPGGFTKMDERVSMNDSGKGGSISMSAIDVPVRQAPNENDGGSISYLGEGESHVEHV